MINYQFTIPFLRCLFLLVKSVTKNKEKDHVQQQSYGFIIKPVQLSGVIFKT